MEKLHGLSILLQEYVICIDSMVKYINKKKGEQIMKSKKSKNLSAKFLANVALKVGKMSANTTCSYIYHQPKMPKELKKAE